MQFLSVKEVLQRLGIVRSTLYAWMKERPNNFPLPVRVGGRVFWEEGLLNDWMSEQVKQADTRDT